MLNYFGTGFILWFIDIKRTSIFPITLFELSSKRTPQMCHACFLLTGRQPNICHLKGLSLPPAPPIPAVSIYWPGLSSPCLQWTTRFCHFSVSIIVYWSLQLPPVPLNCDRGKVSPSCSECRWSYEPQPPPHTAFHGWLLLPIIETCAPGPDGVVTLSLCLGLQYFLRALTRACPVPLCHLSQIMAEVQVLFFHFLL